MGRCFSIDLSKAHLAVILKIVHLVHLLAQPSEQNFYFIVHAVDEAELMGLDTNFADGCLDSLFETFESWKLGCFLVQNYTIAAQTP